MKRVPTALTFSVIVCSRERPESLKRTLLALRQLDYPAFEVIVVGDPSAAETTRRASADWVRVVPHDEPNLSVSRNVGIAAAKGDVCAFLDDDAVPEPLWLRHFCTSLETKNAAAAVGYVRGPDGIRFQSRCHSVDREAETHCEPADLTTPFQPELSAGRAVKLVGTNMVVRRRVLQALSGFDPAYRYFLEDSDLSLRLAQTGHSIAVAPFAEVHHAIAASSRRTHRRVARSLFDVGRSTAIFLRRHPGADPSEIHDRIVVRERRRLLTAMVRGDLEPAHIIAILQTLEEGWTDGMTTELTELPKLPTTEGDFLPVPAISREHDILTSRLLRRRLVLREAARRVVDESKRASVVSRSLTTWRHVVRYTNDGVWLHTGGQFSRTGRNCRGFRWCRFARSVAEEIHRVANQRGLHDAMKRPRAGAVDP